MTQSLTLKDHKHIEAHEEIYSMTTVGFWIYLMTDCILFSCFFAAYAVLHNNTFGGPTSKEIYNLPYVLGETLFLLASSFTCGLAMLSITKDRSKVGGLVGWFIVTFFLGAAFVGMEVNEFVHLVREGNSWARSGFLTGFFCLVGLHGLHVSTGLLWMIILVFPVWKNGLNFTRLKRLTCLRMFWHFLDLVWIFIFTIVYLMGVII